MRNKASIQARIEKARRRLDDRLDRRYEGKRRTTTAYVTSVTRDPVNNQVTGLAATIDGVTDQRVWVSQGIGVTEGDTLRVENRGSAIAPDWTMIGKASHSGGGDGLIDVERLLSTPTGLSLATAVYTPSPSNLRARLAATWDQLADYESVSHYVAELRRDSDGSIISTTVDHVNGASPATASVAWQDLEPNVAYSVRVRAAGYGNARSGFTAWSSQTTAADTTPPAAITGHGYEVLGPGEFRLFWTAASEADLSHYEIDFSLDGSTSLTYWPRAIGNTTEFFLILEPGQGAYWRVRAVDTTGNAIAWGSIAWQGPLSGSQSGPQYGLVYLAPEADLIANMTNVQTSMIVSRQIFANGEFAAIVNGDGNREYVKCTTGGTGDAQQGYTYTITRAADGGTAYAHEAPYTKVYRLGQSGYILADTRNGGTAPADTPFIDLHEWDSPYTGTWGDQTHIVRLGDLSGVTDPNFGGALTGYGLYSANAYLTGSLALAAGSAASPSLFFEDETNTGLYWTEDVGNYSNRLHISLNGTASLNFNETSAGIHEIESPAHIRLQSTNSANVYLYSDSTNLATFFSPLAGDRAYIRGPIQTDLGSVSAPAWSFNADSNTGIYGNGSGNLYLVSNGSTKILMTGSYVRVLTDLELEDGTAAAPSLAYRLNTNTGFYRPGANEVGIAAAGTQVGEFRYNSGSIRGELGLNGDIGVVSDNGDAYLISSTGDAYIQAGAGAIYADGAIRHQDNGSVSDPSYAFSSDIDTGMYLQATGRIGFTAGGAARFAIDDSYIQSAVTHIFETWIRLYEDTAPASNPPTASAYFYLDGSDGSLKIRFDNGTIATIASP